MRFLKNVFKIGKTVGKLVIKHENRVAGINAILTTAELVNVVAKATETKKDDKVVQLLENSANKAIGWDRKITDFTAEMSEKAEKIAQDVSKIDNGRLKDLELSFTADDGFKAKFKKS